MELVSAPKPWTVNNTYVAVHDNTLTASIKDCRGNLIALFRDWRDADAVIRAFVRVEELEAEIKELEITNERLWLSAKLYEQSKH